MRKSILVLYTLMLFVTFQSVALTPNYNTTLLQLDGSVISHQREGNKNITISSPDIEKLRLEHQSVSSRSQDEIIPTFTIYGPAAVDKMFDVNIMEFIDVDNINNTTFGYPDGLGEDSECYWGVPEGKYHVVASGSYTSNMDEPWMIEGIVFLYGEIDLTQEYKHIDLYFDSATHQITYQPLTPFGEPVTDLEEDGSNLVFSALRDVKLSLGNFITGIEAYDNNYGFYVSDFPEQTSILCSMQQFNEDETFFVDYCVRTGAITEDINVVTNTNKYQEFISRFSLTPNDQQIFSGLAIDDETLFDFGQGIWQGERSNKSIITQKKQFDSCKAYVVLPESHQSLTNVFYEQAFRQGVVVSATVSFMGVQPVYKNGAYRLKLEDGIIFVPQSVSDPEHGHSFTSYPEIMYIEEPEIYFTKALYGRTWELGWEENEETDEYEFTGEYNIYGPENESITGLKMTDFITSLIVNGEEYTLKQLNERGKRRGDKIDITLTYDNILIDEEIPSSNVIEFNYQQGAEDPNAPTLRMYQVRDVNGITNKVSQDATLYIGAHSTSSWAWEFNPDFTTKVYVSPQETEDWILIENGEIIGEWPNSIGRLFAFDLNDLDLVGGQWYKIRVEINDELGKYSRQTINHCFQAVKNTNITEIETIADENAVYYTLQGIQAEPSVKGLLIKVANGKATKVLRK